MFANTINHSRRLTYLACFLILLSSVVLATPIAVGGTTYNYVNASLNYTVHVFTANDTFNLSGDINGADILMIGGGGGGGSNAGGGGGAGGLIWLTNISIPQANYTMVIGRGGAVNTTGQNTTFWNLTALGGGGSSGVNTSGKNGGSGGAAGANTVLGTPYSGGLGLQPSSTWGGYGNIGGSTPGNSNSPTGGGGGAGSAGQNGTGSGASAKGGDGGYGLNLSINGSLVCYAGGGGGASGIASNGAGFCGGGNVSTDAVNGTGGGGGSVRAGASGIIIIRYVPTLVQNLTQFYTANQSDLFPYLYQLNFTLVGATNVTAQFDFEGTNTSVTPAISGNDYSFSIQKQSSFVFQPTQKNFSWHYSYTVNVTMQESTSPIEITVNPSGLSICNTSNMATSLVYSFTDAINGSSINATLFSSYSINNFSSSFVGTNITTYVCITPAFLNATATMTEVVSAYGYYSTSIVRTLQVSNASQNVQIQMMPISSSVATTITLQQLPNIPISGVLLTIEKFNTTSDTILLEGCTTNQAGICIVYLTPNAQQYRYNFSFNGQNYSYVEILTCDVSATMCYRTFSIGSTLVLPPTLAGTVSGTCSYNNISNFISCTGSSTNNSISQFNLNLYVMGAATPTCSNVSSLAAVTLTCYVPPVNGTTYEFYFWGNNSISPQLIYGGQIIINQSSAGNYGRDGWLVVLFLFVALAAIGAANIYVGIILGIVSLVISVMINLVPPLGLIPIIALTAVMGGVVIYKLKV